jgi:hypothetical protein
LVEVGLPSRDVLLVEVATLEAAVVVLGAKVALPGHMCQQPSLQLEDLAATGLCPP